MTIPKSYEALAADLASEKILSKTLLGQKEAYMMLTDNGRLDLATWKQKACEAAEREAALREELAALRESYEAMRDRKSSIVYLQQRLTVAEQRAADNLKLIIGLVEYADNLLADVNNAWIYAGSTGEPETHKDEDYAAALNLLSATVSSHE